MSTTIRSGDGGHGAAIRYRQHPPTGAPIPILPDPAEPLARQHEAGDTARLVLALILMRNGLHPDTHGAQYSALIQLPGATVCITGADAGVRALFDAFGRAELTEAQAAAVAKHGRYMLPLGLDAQRDAVALAADALAAARAHDGAPEPTTR